MKKQKKQLSIKNKLTTVFIVILLVPTLSVGWFSFSSAKQQILEQQESYAKSSTEILNSSISNNLNAKINDLDYLVERLSKLPLKTNKESEVRSVLNEYVHSHGDVAMAYIGTSTNDMIRMPYFRYGSDYKPTERDWYKESIGAEDYTISPPYNSATSGELVVTISKKLNNNKGVVGLDVSIQEFNSIANSISIGKKGYLSIVDTNNHYISHPSKKIGSEIDADLSKFLASNEEKRSKDHLTQSSNTNDLTGWKIISNIHESEATTTANSIWNEIIIVLIISFVLFSIVSIIVITSILKPIRLLRENAMKISEGDLTIQVDTSGTNEVALLAKAFHTMKEQLSVLIIQLQGQAHSIKSSADSLSENARENSASSQEISRASQYVSISTEEQMNHVEQSSESINEISQGINGIAEDASGVTELSVIAHEQAVDGGEHIEKNVQQMNAISDAVAKTDVKIRALYDTTKEIGSILEMIQTIANQTNLLALNASIEAARAGEHGKGFAVVAEEVRKLAESSQQSASQIEELIVTVQHDTRATVDIMAETMTYVREGTDVTKDTAARFTTIIDSMRAITPRMENMTAASEEIAATITDVAKSTTTLSDIAKDNAAAAQQVSASSEQSLSSIEGMESTAQELQQLAEQLNRLIKQFKLP